MTPEEFANLLEQARQEANPARARALLSQAIKTDPKSEVAWLLFSEVAEKDEHAIYCLEQVLKINPENQLAAQQLQLLKALPMDAPLAEPEPIHETPMVDAPETAPTIEFEPSIETPKVDAPETATMIESEPSIETPMVDAPETAPTIESEPSIETPMLDAHETAPIIEAESTPETLVMIEPELAPIIESEPSIETPMVDAPETTPIIEFEPTTGTSIVTEAESILVPEPEAESTIQEEGDTQPVRPLPVVQTQPARNEVPKLASQPRTTLRTEKVHWATGLGSILLLIFGLIVSYVSAINLDTVEPVLDMLYPVLLVIGLILILLGVIGIFLLIAVLFTHSFSLTREKIIVHKGQKSRASYELPLADLKTIQFRQSLGGRILGYGKIILTTRDGSRKVLKGVQHPREFCQAVQAQMAELPVNHSG